MIHAAVYDHIRVADCQNYTIEMLLIQPRAREALICIASEKTELSSGACLSGGAGCSQGAGEVGLRVTPNALKSTSSQPVDETDDRSVAAIYLSTSPGASSQSSIFSDMRKSGDSENHWNPKRQNFNYEMLVFAITKKN